MPQVNTSNPVKDLIALPVSVTMRNGIGYVRFRINPEYPSEISASFIKILKSHPF